MDQKKYQIFISSTYKDLINIRDKVVGTVLSMYQFPIGMEMFSADDDKQWAVIQETIDMTDYYILIIGHRYGSETKKGISFTEKEFLYAKEKGIPILAFIRNRNIATTPEEREEDPQKIEKLNAFIEKVTKNKLCEFWDSADELARRVVIALAKIFSKSPRIGWIRADRAISPEVSSELATLIKENRELRTELENINAQIESKKPNIILNFGDNENILLKLEELKKDEIKYLTIPPLITNDAITQELMQYIKADEISYFNANLPSDDKIEKYNVELEKWWRLRNTGDELFFSVINDGSYKGNEIYIEMQFPESVVVIEKHNREMIIPPPWPLPPNPIRIAEHRKKESLRNKKNIFSVGDINFPSINPVSLRTDFIQPPVSTDLGNNKITVQIKSLIHTRKINFDDEYILVPFTKGEFYLNISIICEEYPELRILKRKITIK